MRTSLWNWTCRTCPGLRQLRHNLVRNGMEAMLHKEILTIRTYLEGEEVILVVTDRGGGIPPDLAENIEMPFFTTKDTGTGLGLAVCCIIRARNFYR